MRNSLAFSLDEAILTGSGVGQPLGILNSGAAVLSARGTPGSIGFADLVGMAGRVLPSSLAKAVWLVSPSAFAVLAGLVITAGTGQLVMGYLPGAADIKMQILGHPVRVTEKLPTLGAAGDVVLCDLSYYGLAMRETARFERTNAAQWTSDIVDFRFVLRCDGKPLIAQPFTPSGGGNTLSPFVVLDA
jgi:HK97 family phage major capsid protein